MDLYCQLNESVAPLGSLLEPFGLDVAQQVGQFHVSLPNYAPTPLVALPNLADRLGITTLSIKDERSRFGLKSFKGLGASFAIAAHLAAHVGLGEEGLTFERILAHKDEYRDRTFVTATDGNHGCAVAWAAKLFGCSSVVYMPKGTAMVRLEAIRNYGAEASVTSLSYDQTVLLAESSAHDKGWLLMQDTSWDAYQHVPLAIMQGYSTLVTEYIYQGSGAHPTHVFLQAGVGSMAASVVAFMHCYVPSQLPTFVIIEPDGAPCFYESARKRPASLATINGELPTIMAGLACGTPSLIAWNILRHSASAFVRCSDSIAMRGMKVLGNPLSGDPRVISGESGAVTLGVLFEILSNPMYQTIKEQLGLTAESSVLLFSTEGDTNPHLYRDVVWT